jgi:hypothetical protein
LKSTAPTYPAQARRELRDWIKRGLVTEREGRIHETDALKTALHFVAQLDGRMMTSTASRLAVVQREIDNLATALNPDPQSRTEHLQRRIADCSSSSMMCRRAASHAHPEQAVEGIREVYALAPSACAPTFGGWKTRGARPTVRCARPSSAPAPPGRGDGPTAGWPRQPAQHARGPRV